MKIQTGGLFHPTVVALLNEHLDDMAEHSPPDCVHALSLDELGDPSVSFWTAWDGTELLGCGALKELDLSHGEIKSMRTARKALKRGVASVLLEHIIEQANIRSYRRLSLETGSGPVFEPAHELYRKFGFQSCGPFADYEDDPFSRFMTMAL